MNPIKEIFSSKPDKVANIPSCMEEIDEPENLISEAQGILDGIRYDASLCEWVSEIDKDCHFNELLRIVGSDEYQRYYIVKRNKYVDEDYIYLVDKQNNYCTIRLNGIGYLTGLFYGRFLKNDLSKPMHLFCIKSVGDCRFDDPKFKGYEINRMRWDNDAGRSYLSALDRSVYYSGR